MKKKAVPPSAPNTTWQNAANQDSTSHFSPFLPFNELLLNPLPSLFTFTMFKLARSRPIAAAFRAATVRYLSFAETFESYNSTFFDNGIAHRSLPFNLAFANNRETCRSMNICPRSCSSRYEQPNVLIFFSPSSLRTN